MKSDQSFNMMLYFQSNEQNEYTNRRMSDPSESFGSFVRGGIRRLSLKKSRSEAEDVNAETQNCQEVEATTPQKGKLNVIYRKASFVFFTDRQVSNFLHTQEVEAEMQVSFFPQKGKFHWLVLLSVQNSLMKGKFYFLYRIL
jgi:hypothetical protein